jgi:hypothetical protein
MQEDRMADTVSGAGRMCRQDSNQRQDEGQVMCQAGYKVGQAGRDKTGIKKGQKTRTGGTTCSTYFDM